MILRRRSGALTPHGSDAAQEGEEGGAGGTKRARAEDVTEDVIEACKRTGTCALRRLSARFPIRWRSHLVSVGLMASSGLLTPPQARAAPSVPGLCLIGSS
eukprot:141519-Prorocentrum_minimum.AAC.1